MQRDLVHNVVGVAEDADVHPVAHDARLRPQRRRKLVAVVRGARFLTRSRRNDTVQILVHLRGFRRIEPDLAPVFAVVARHYVDHVFCGIGAWRTCGVVAGEVVFERGCVGADVSEVDSFAAFGEE